MICPSWCESAHAEPAGEPSPHECLVGDAGPVSVLLVSDDDRPAGVWVDTPEDCPLLPPVQAGELARLVRRAAEMLESGGTS